jgi:hypothetical protein
MVFKRVVGMICFAAWLSMLVCRFDLLQAFGHGTGTNRVLFSPLDVAAFTGIYSARLRGQEQYAKAVFAGLGVPGELYRRAVSGEDMGRAVDVWEASIKWSRDPRMKQIVKPKEDVGSGIAGLACVASIIVAMFSPRNASFLFLVGLTAMQASLKGFEPSVKLTETYGFYSVGCAVVSSLML